MNNAIKFIVSECERLSVQENVGSRYRITREDFRGSLWVTPQKSNFRVLISGEIDPLLSGFLRAHFGSEAGVDQGKKYWNLGDLQNVAKIIRRFNER